ncbi:hypothetical protein [Ramlibacter sp. PS4R-6]|uniref:hypothetical protein n=1 Tax=Ramlibacter sp. PS4R-6 TaxID=3133438 RepID=UPI0030968549
MFDNTFLARVLWKCACAAAVPLCLAIAAVQALAPARAVARPQPAVELPSQWDGRRLRPLVLTEVEQRFARHFPGRIARMTDGENMLVLRTVVQPTRMLHPAADCYRGVGWRIEHVRLQLDDEQLLWRCFDARRGGDGLRVCERIVDARGQAFTDASSWYWAALLGQSQGPWQAVTVAGPL